MSFLSVFIWILTFVLILVSFFLVMVVLMQKSKDGGIGAALGGGAAEAAFGAETANVLTRATKYSAIVFFVLAFALYLGRIYERKHAGSGGATLPNIAAPAAAAPAAPATGANPGAPGVSLPAANTAPATATTPESATTAPASTPVPAPKKE
ncbi:MAG: preprotein translocase subunit SecG [Opitutaceae bacterium]|nr:preprotein translocase subunit SecG [Opitutaceae bacterium]